MKPAALCLVLGCLPACVVDEDCGEAPSLPSGTSSVGTAPTAALLAATVEFTKGALTIRYTDDTGAEWTVVYAIGAG